MFVFTVIEFSHLSTITIIFTSIKLLLYSAWFFHLNRKILKWGITKSCDHPRPPTTSHNIAASTHDHPRLGIILAPALMTTHNLLLFHHRHPQLRTLLKNELFQSYFSTTLHRLIEHTFWFANQSIDFFGSSQWEVSLGLSCS